MLDEKTIETVKAALQDYAAAYSRCDAESVLALTAPEFMAFGSGSDEVCTDRDEYAKGLERDFIQCDDLVMEFDDIRVAGVGDAAWIAAGCTITPTFEGKSEPLRGRMTAVFRRDGERWLCTLTHFSLPCSEQEEGESSPSSE
ncbi:nuclear transport factor 2 family protein [Methanoculleus frigidifontis]|nr:nuclear transport factor 2 family protein [Methanoculleus sp. FWC-SCC1]